MRERIEKLARGNVSWHRPGLKISQTNITLTVEAGTVGHGSFLLESIDERPVRGLVYTSSGRIRLEQNQFDGTSFLVSYTFDAEGLASDEDGQRFMEKSTFYVVSDGGEYEIPITVFLKESSGPAVKGKVRSITDLVRTAQKNFKEAFQLFGSGSFALLLKKELPAYETLYRGLRGRGLTEWDLEEFLVAIGEKEKLKLQISSPEKEFFELENSKKVTMKLTKNTWGYLPVRVESDALFLEPEKQHFNTTDFTGNEMEFTYVVSRKKVHDGNNFGRITFVTPYQVLTHEVTIHAPLDRDVSFEGRKDLKRCEMELLNTYIDFRMKRKNRMAWTSRSLQLLERLRSLDPENEYYPLFQVQMYLAESRYEESKWILDKYAKRRWGRGQNYELYAYYLYLSTIYRKDAAYTKRVRDEIHRLYVRDKKWQYVWLLLYLDQNLTAHPEKRLEMIRQQFERRNGSVILYLEACQILAKDCTLIGRLDDFTTYILALGVRRGAVTQELAIRVAELSRQEKRYSDLLSHMLKRCYERYPDPAILSAVCSMLIKGNKTGPEDFKWYEKGITSGVKITRIFEYYIYSLPADGSGKYQELPKNLLLYFAWQTNLEERKRALLYASVIQHAEKYPVIYSDFRRQMEEFMAAQLKKRAISRELALIYKTFLTPGIMDEELAKALADILFTWEIRIDGELGRSIKNVIIVHQDLEREQIVACTGGTAYVQIYSEHYQMFFQDTRGIRYISTVPCEKRRLLDTALYDQLCADYPCRSTGYLLHKWRRQPLQEENVPLYVELYRSPHISDQSRQFIQKEVLMSYQLMDDQDWVSEFIPDLNYDMLRSEERRVLMEVLLEQGLFERAYALFCHYGTCRARPGRLVKMAARMIREKEYGLEEELLYLTSDLFDADVYDRTVLEYLTEYYNRDSRSMAKLWEAAREFELETYKLEERLIPQVLFTGMHISNLKDMFAVYYRHMPNRRIRQAYLTEQSFQYFVKRSLPDPELFRYLEAEYAREQKLNQICQLALLDHYAGKTISDDPKQKMLRSFMEGFVYKGKIAACFLRYDRTMTEALFLTEKVVIEHRAAPDVKVMLYYKIVRNGRGGNYIGEVMKQLCEGVYAKQLPLFYGEQVQYYITEISADGETKTTVMELENEAVANLSGSAANTRSGYLNRMHQVQETADEEQLQQLMEEYQEKIKATEWMFTIRQGVTRLE